MMGQLYHVLSDGLPLVAEVFGEGRPLVFSHGLTNNRQQACRLMAPLLSRFRLVTFDQRGHGESAPVTAPELYAPQRMAGDIAAVMDALGIHRAVVAGESMGAATALLFALRWPERVEQLLLVAPAFGDRPNPACAKMTDLGRRLSTAQGVEDYVAEALAGEWREAGFSSQTVDCLAGYMRSHQPASIGAACAAVAGWLIFEDVSDLARLTCPVHIIAWDGDLVHPVDLAERMAGALPAATLITIPSMATLFNDMPSVGRMFGPYLGAGEAALGRGAHAAQ